MTHRKEKPVIGSALKSLARLYREVDRRMNALYALHGERLRCRRGCASCCVDNITVFEVEAANIRRNHAEVMATKTPHPTGACAFLDDKDGCRIYASRPYVCRTQGPPLRWIEEMEDGSFAEMRDICPLNEAGVPIEELPPESCWSIGPVESELARLQEKIDSGARQRVSLRAMFKREPDR